MLPLLICLTHEVDQTLHCHSGLPNSFPPASSAWLLIWLALYPPPRPSRDMGDQGHLPALLSALVPGTLQQCQTLLSTLSCSTSFQTTHKVRKSTSSTMSQQGPLTFKEIFGW